MYDRDDKERPGLGDLIQLVDKANNTSLGEDWSIWNCRYQKRSPLFGEIIEIYLDSAANHRKKEKIIHKLLDKPDAKNGWTPLHWAAVTGRRDKMEILMRHNAEIFHLSPSNRNIVHIAAESRQQQAMAYAAAIWEHNKDQIDINFKDRWQDTPLHIAATGSAGCVPELIKHGADVQVKQENQQVPLHCASVVANSEEKYKIVDIISSVQGYHINPQDEDGRSPIFQFLNSPDRVDLLIRHGAQRHLVDASGRTVFHYAVIEDELKSLEILLRGCSDKIIGTADHQGHTPLSQAFSLGRVDCARLLIKSNAIGAFDGKDGMRLVHHAAMWGNVEILELAMTHASFQRRHLTDTGKVNTRCGHGGTKLGRKSDRAGAAIGLQDKTHYHLNAVLKGRDSIQYSG